MKTARLDEVAKFASGGTPPRGNVAFYEGDIPWITGADINPDGSIRARLSISEEAVRRSSTQVLPGGTVALVTRTSVGKVGVFNRPTAFSQDITAISPSPDLVAGYLVHFLRTQAAHLSSLARGATIKGVTREVVAGLTVPVPPIAEQRRIAAILDAADATRAKRLVLLGQLGTLVQAIFFERFGNPLRPPRDATTARIGSVARVVTGNSPSRAVLANFGGEIEWIKSDNLGGALATRAHEGLSAQGRQRARIAPAGSILVTCIAGSPTSIGKCSLVDRDVAFNQQINAILPSESLEPAFLLAQLKLAPELVQLKSSGGMKGLVSKSAFESIEILVPDLEAQLQFTARASAVDAARTKVERALAADHELFASLQSRAFSGAL